MCRLGHRTPVIGRLEQRDVEEFVLLLTTGRGAHGPVDERLVIWRLKNQ